MAHLRWERRGEIAELTIDRPEKRNAMSFEMWSQLPGLCAEVDADDAVKVLVVRGEGPHFCAGADIGEFGTRRATPGAAEAYGEQVDAATRALTEMRKPSVAMIRGYCIGGGCELAMACDLRFADRTAEFAITPAKLGIVFNFGSTRRLVTLVGPSFARYLLFSGERVPVEHALRVGLVDRIEDPDGLAGATDAFASTICSRSQVSVQGSKAIIAEIVAGVDEAGEDARRLTFDAVNSADYREGVEAFLQKRPPRFTAI